jgi:hypothetical protein
MQNCCGWSPPGRARMTMAPLAALDSAAGSTTRAESLEAARGLARAAAGGLGYSQAASHRQVASRSRACLGACMLFPERGKWNRWDSAFRPADLPGYIEPPMSSGWLGGWMPDRAVSSLNCFGVRYPRLECGRSSLRCWRQVSMMTRAADAYAPSRLHDPARIERFCTVVHRIGHQSHSNDIRAAGLRACPAGRVLTCIDTTPPIVILAAQWKHFPSFHGYQGA